MVRDGRERRTLASSYAQCGLARCRQARPGLVERVSSPTFSSTPPCTLFTNRVNDALLSRQARFTATFRHQRIPTFFFSLWRAGCLGAGTNSGDASLRRSECRVRSSPLLGPFLYNGLFFFFLVLTETDLVRSNRPLRSNKSHEKKQGKKLHWCICRRGGEGVIGSTHDRFRAGQ